MDTQSKKTHYLIVNFGGPRNLEEIESFLIALLQDKDVIRSQLPQGLHNWVFSRVAKKRARFIRADYEKIGGGSPIFADTETLASCISEILGAKTFTFHRYLPQTHPAFLKQVEGIDTDEICIFPCFPQFSYATTGSIARFFQKHLSRKQIRHFKWIPSYAGHSAYITCMQRNIEEFLRIQNLKEEGTILLFSAHGVPKDFIDTGDPYESQCLLSFQRIKEAFPKALSKLSYQSKFGKGEWLQPYTNEVCKSVLQWCQGRGQVVIIPLSFTSDHMETLFEIEHQYLPLIRASGLKAFRCPALNLREEWIRAISEILQKADVLDNQALIYQKHG